MRQRLQKLAEGRCTRSTWALLGVAKEMHQKPCSSGPDHLAQGAATGAFSNFHLGSGLYSIFDIVYLMLLHMRPAAACLGSNRQKGIILLVFIFKPSYWPTNTLAACYCT